MNSTKNPSSYENGFNSGPPRGIRTPDLQNRNLLRYPAAPWTEIGGNNFGCRIILFGQSLFKPKASDMHCTVQSTLFNLMHNSFVKSQIRIVL